MQTTQDELKSRFQKDGFVAIPEFLNPSEIARLGEAIGRLIDETVPNLPRERVFYEDVNNRHSLKQIQKLFEYDSYFHRMMFGSRFENLAKTLLGREVRGINMQYFNKPPGTGRPTPAHQDGYYFMLEPNEAVTMWLALDEVDEENGCVRYLPASHLFGLRPHGPTETLGFSQGLLDGSLKELKEEIPIPAKPGDLLVHHALTIHRADENRSVERQRRAIGLIYYADDAVENPEKEQRQAELLARWKLSGRI